jgi:hypothetical protein
MMVVQELVEVSAVVLEQELVPEENDVRCASVYSSCSSSRRNIATYEQLPVKQFASKS